MSNYQNGTIYKIVCKDPEITDCYVGSTTSHLKRKSRHKSNCNNKNSKDYNYPVYRFIRDHGGWENWQFVPIEDYPCRTKKQLNIRERFWFEKLNATLNSHYPQRSIKEYREDNKEKIREEQKEYREKHKEELKEKRKDYLSNPEVKEKIKEQNKEWEEKNKEKRKEKRRESDKKRYEKNKEKLKEKVKCECGSIVSKSGLTQHKKSQKHQKWEKTQVE
jgi:hypothetical protein